MFNMRRTYEKLLEEFVLTETRCNTAIIDIEMAVNNINEILEKKKAAKKLYSRRLNDKIKLVGDHR